MEILIVEDIKRWEQLIIKRLDDEAEITVVCSISRLEEILSSGKKFFAIALDGWLGEDTTFGLIPRLLEISEIVISTSQDLKLRKKMIQAGCHTGGNKWDFADLMIELSL